MGLEGSEEIDVGPDGSEQHDADADGLEQNDADTDGSEQNDADADSLELHTMDSDGWVTIGGQMKKLPKISMNQEQPAENGELTAWFLANAAVHTGSSKIFEVKSLPVCTAQWRKVTYTGIQKLTV